MTREEALDGAEALAKGIEALQVRSGVPSLMLLASHWGEHGVFGEEVLHGPQFKWRDQEKGKRIEVGLLSSMLGMIEAQCEKLRRESVAQYSEVFNQAVNTNWDGYLRQWGLSPRPSR